jgi:hypothetical protein
MADWLEPRRIVERTRLDAQDAGAIGVPVE